MNEIKIFALGGLDEQGKNMLVLEINNKIFIVECGIKLPDSSLLGVEYVVCDFSYLIKNKKRIAGIFITHAHDDVMRGLPYLIKQINIPIYTTKFTSLFLEDLLHKEHVDNYKINIVKANDDLKVGGINIKTFAMTHATPDNFGIAFRSKQGYIVYSGEFVFDYNNTRKEYMCDLSRLSEIGEAGVLCLLSESTGADQEGHTAPRHLITNRIESTFENHEGRIIVGCYNQSLYRIIEILDLCKKYHKKVFIYDYELVKALRYLNECGYYHIPKGLLITTKTFNNDLDDIVILVSEAGKRLFLKMTMIAMHDDKLVDLHSDDQVIVVSPAINGCEKDAVNMENEIYKEGAKVLIVKARDVYGMHGSKEDLKMLLHLLKPKYYLPVKGEYRHLIANAKVASAMGLKDDRILILDNGQIATFEKGKLVNTTKVLKLEDNLIDGREDLDVTGVVLKDREILSTDGVVIIGVTLDRNKKQIMSGIDIQTRGLVYLKNAEELLSEVEKMVRKIINDEVKNKTYENLECRNLIREKVTKFISKETGKRPMVLPVILEIKKNSK